MLDPLLVKGRIWLYFVKLHDIWTGSMFPSSFFSLSNHLPHFNFSSLFYFKTSFKQLVIWPLFLFGVTIYLGTWIILTELIQLHEHDWIKYLEEQWRKLQDMIPLWNESQHIPCVIYSNLMVLLKCNWTMCSCLFNKWVTDKFVPEQTNMMEVLIGGNRSLIVCLWKTLLHLDLSTAYLSFGVFSPLIYSNLMMII